MAEVNRDARIAARCRRRELEVVKAAASAEGLHVSELVRQATLSAARQKLARLGDENDNGGS